MKRTLLIVTGASKGFGRAICHAFFEKNSIDVNRNTSTNTIARVCLVARSQQGLEETKEFLQNNLNASNEACVITTHVVDLGQLDSLEIRLQEIMDMVSPTHYDHLILVNNAGSLGEIGPIMSSKSPLQHWQRTIDLNITSMLWITRSWGQWTIQHKLPTATLVNISSLLAIQPFPTMSLYAAGKAVRIHRSFLMKRSAFTQSIFIPLSCIRLVTCTMLAWPKN